MRQFRNDFREWQNDAQALRRELSQAGVDTKDLDQILRDLRAFDSDAAFTDGNSLALLQQQALDKLKKFEFGCAVKPKAATSRCRCQVPTKCRRVQAGDRGILPGARQETVGVWRWAAGAGRNERMRRRLQFAGTKPTASRPWPIAVSQRSQNHQLPLAPPPPDLPPPKLLDELDELDEPLRPDGLEFPITHPLEVPEGPPFPRPPFLDARVMVRQRSLPAFTHPKAKVARAAGTRIVRDALKNGMSASTKGIPPKSAPQSVGKIVFVRSPTPSDNAPSTMNMPKNTVVTNLAGRRSLSRCRAPAARCPSGDGWPEG